MADTSKPAPIEMEEDAEYRRQLALFTRCCTEKPVELVKIGEVIAGLKHRRCFLDIGAGGGDLTIPTSQSFSEATVIEPNEKQIAFLKRRCPHFTIYNGRWEAVDLGDKHFDFILCSRHLEPGGCIAIVLQSPIGEVASFFNQFTSYDVNILELWRELIRRYGDVSVDVRYFMNEIYTESLDDMVSIGLFLLIDRRFTKRKNDIRRYFRKHHRSGNGYRIMQDEILLAVKKPVAA